MKISASLVAFVVAASSELFSASAQPGGPGGPPIDIITSDTTLTADQSTPIVIGANYITLDCGGFTLTSPPPPFPGGPPAIFNGITLNNRIGITIKNCKLEGWLSGISLQAFSSVTLENIETNGNVVHGLDANDSSSIQMRGDFTANNNGVFGINMQNDVSLTMKESDAVCSGNSAGVQIGLRSSYTMIQGPGAEAPSTLEAFENRSFGVTATSNSHLFLFGTTVVKAYKNGSNGVTSFSKSAIELDRQAVIESYDNTLNGFRIEDSSINLFTINPETVPVLKSYNNGAAGIFLNKVGIFDTNADADIEITDNEGGGLVVDNNSLATVRGATITGNTQDGDARNVYLSFGSHGDFEGNTIEGDKILCDFFLGNYLRGDYRFCRTASFIFG